MKIIITREWNNLDVLYKSLYINWQETGKIEYFLLRDKMYGPLLHQLDIFPIRVKFELTGLD